LTDENRHYSKPRVSFKLHSPMFSGGSFPGLAWFLPTTVLVGTQLETREPPVSWCSLPAQLPLLQCSLLQILSFPDSTYISSTQLGEPVGLCLHFPLLTSPFGRVGNCRAHPICFLFFSDPCSVLKTVIL
jgi:hypothetical protein